MKIKNCLIIEYLNLPKKWKDWFTEKQDWRIHNDTMIEYLSEFTPETKGGYTKEALIEWYNECKEDNETFEYFLKDTGADFEYWLMGETDLSKVESIIINVCW